MIIKNIAGYSFYIMNIMARRGQSINWVRNVDVQPDIHLPDEFLHVAKEYAEENLLKIIKLRDADTNTTTIIENESEVVEDTPADDEVSVDITIDDIDVAPVAEETPKVETPKAKPKAKTTTKGRPAKKTTTKKK